MQTEEMAMILMKVKQFLPRGSPVEINPDLAGTWCTLLTDYSDEQIKQTFRDTISHFEYWPTPKEIIREINGGCLTDKEAGQDSASRIEAAISKFGYRNVEDAKEYIGHVGWLTVDQLGGWTRVCETTNDDLPSAKKSWRELSEVNAKRVSRGQIPDPEALPEGSQTSTPLRSALALAMGSQKSDIVVVDTNVNSERQEPIRSLSDELRGIKQR